MRDALDVDTEQKRQRTGVSFRNFGIVVAIAYIALKSRNTIDGGSCRHGRP